jgi:hypothetical protein
MWAFTCTAELYTEYQTMQESYGKLQKGLAKGLDTLST